MCSARAPLSCGALLRTHTGSAAGTVADDHHQRAVADVLRSHGARGRGLRRCVPLAMLPCATAHEQRRTRAGRNTFIHLAKKITTHPPDLRAGANYVKEECGRQAAHGGGTRARLADCASGALVSFCAHTRPGGRLTVTPVSERTGRQWCDRRCEPWRPRMLSQTSRQLSGASKGRFTVGWCQTAGGTASTATAAGAATMALGKRLSGNSARETRPSRASASRRALASGVLDRSSIRTGHCFPSACRSCVADSAVTGRAE